MTSREAIESIFDAPENAASIMDEYERTRDKNTPDAAWLVEYGTQNCPVEKLGQWVRALQYLQKYVKKTNAEPVSSIANKVDERFFNKYVVLLFNRKCLNHCDYCSRLGETEADASDAVLLERLKEAVARLDALLGGDWTPMIEGGDPALFSTKLIDGIDAVLNRKAIVFTNSNEGVYPARWQRRLHIIDWVGKECDPSVESTIVATEASVELESFLILNQSVRNKIWILPNREADIETQAAIYRMCLVYGYSNVVLQAGGTSFIKDFPMRPCDRVHTSWVVRLIGDEPMITACDNTRNPAYVPLDEFNGLIDESRCATCVAKCI